MKINYYAKTKNRNIGDYDEVDCRFNKQTPSYNGSDSRIGRKRLTKRPRAKRTYSVIWLANLTPFEWTKLLFLALCGFMILSWYLYK